ncbi:MAG TPA: flagellar biosynthesis anti-sigma factor FlgM [Candidatus Aquilonibacter sp.]|nr:flagellar biosynthesis anti-sigma factor FlgM [Candidatus Aquilonibacter sp.]
MRIDANLGAQGLPETEPSGNQSASKVGGQPAGAASGGVLGEDQAELSDTYAQVQALTAQALQFPEIRQEKVNALRQVVQDGSYQPSSDQIAGAMFTNMLAMPAA